MSSQLFRAMILAFTLVLLTLASNTIAPNNNQLHGVDIALAAPLLNCNGSVSGYNLTIDKDHSSVSGNTVICNYAAASQEANPTTSGFAITVEYFCAKDTQDAWKSKTGSPQPLWDPNNNPNGRIGAQGGNSLLIREDGLVSGFSGDFTVSEKLFLLIDSQTIATVVVHTDVKRPPAPPNGPAPNPDPNILNLGATNTDALARTVAAAHRAIVNNLECASAPTTAPPEKFKVMIDSRDEEQDLFIGNPMWHCCLPKQVRVMVFTEANRISGAQTQLYFDDVLVGTSVTDGNGEVIFEVNLPESLPKGRSTHILKAQVQKTNGPPVLGIATVEIARETSSIAVSLDPITGEFFPGDPVPVSGHVWSLANGLFMDPVRANITVVGRSPANTSTDNDGFFQVSASVTTDAGVIKSGQEFFAVMAMPLDQKYENGRTDFRVTVKTKGQLVVSATTDKVAYDQGDSVVISGNVSADGKPIAGNVSIVLWNGNKAATASSSSGQFSMSMPLIPTVPRPPGVIIPPIMAGTYYASVQAEAKGYTASSVTDTYFTVLNPLCRAGRIAVTSVVGSPLAVSRNLNPDSPSYGNPRDQELRSGDTLAQGLEVVTLGSDKATLAFDLGNGAYATVALNGSTRITIGRYCQDTSGRVTLYLKMTNPGQVAVNVSHPTGVTPNFQIVTQSSTVSSVHTRYIVTVDPAGATHVAALDGVVRVGDPNGANSIDVAAGKLISVQRNQPPNKLRAIPITGKVDPALGSLLAKAAPPRGSAFPPLGSHGGAGMVPGAGPSGGPGMPPAGGPVGGLGPAVSRGAGGGGGTTSPTIPQVSDLTGLWLDNGGRAVYRVRQVGNKVYWSVDAGTGGSINVYVGEISSNVINGVWVDLPQSASYNTGQLNLRIDSNDHLTKVGENPCCYGAQEWRRQGTTAAAPPPSHAAPPPSGVAPPPGVGGGTGATGGSGSGPTGRGIDWTETAARLNLRGKNGQHFSYTCPPKGSTSGIWGTDIYTDDSLICVAAVHAGLITFQNGGPVTIEILPGLPSYAGSVRNGVSSSPYNAFPGSYKFMRDIVGLQQQVLPREAGPSPQAGATGGRVSMESNTNRPGQDYRNFDLAQPRPELCQTECAGDAKCKAYTYVKPGLQGPKGHCWLKSAVPPPQPNSCCVSGMKGSK